MVNNHEAALDHSFQAMAHPVRRAIVRRLASGSATVGDATRGIGVSKPAITKHLHVLEQAGIVNRAIRGRTHLLTLRPGPLDEAAAWIDGQRRLWKRKMDVIAEYLGEVGE